MTPWGLLLLALVGWAQEPATVDVSADAGFMVVLDQAKSAYFDGGHAAARALLEELAQRIRQGEQVDEEAVAEALTYLGEIQYKSGDQAASWDTFREILIRDTSRTISPYHHPNDVVAWFELVRRQVIQELDNTPDPTPPDPVTPPHGGPPWVGNDRVHISMPWTAYAPLGLPQLAGGRPGRGALYGVGELALGTLSVVGYLRLNQVNHPSIIVTGGARVEAQVYKKAVQWPATVGFYGLWLASHLDERQHRRADAAAVTTLARLDIGPQRVTLTVSSAF